MTQSAPLPDTPPRLRRCADVHLEPAVYAGRSFTLPDLDSFHLISYTAEISQRGERRSVRPGDWIVTPRGWDFTFHELTAGRHHYFHFRYAGRKGIAALLPLHGNFERELPFYLQESLQIIADFKRELAPAKRLAACGLHRLFLRLRESAEGGLGEGTARARRRSDVAVDQAALWLRAHLTEPLSLAELAKKFSLAPNYLGSRFGERTGMTLTHYHMKARLEHALYLLEHTTMPFKWIAAETGFGDAHHFNKSVRRYFGKNPTQLRHGA